MSIKQQLARKAVKTTAKHTAHGTASKLKRDPARTGTLLLLGCVLGLFAGWVAGKYSAAADDLAAPGAIS